MATPRVTAREDVQARDAQQRDTSVGTLPPDCALLVGELIEGTDAIKISDGLAHG